MRRLQRMGNHSILLHNRYFHALALTFVQLDELYARVRTGVHWLWLAIDPVTKTIPSLHLGGRNQEDAHALLHDLRLRLDENSVPAFTSDGLRSYFYANTTHFGYWFLVLAFSVVWADRSGAVAAGLRNDALSRGLDRPTSPLEGASLFSSVHLWRSGRRNLRKYQKQLVSSRAGTN